MCDSGSLAASTVSADMNGHQSNGTNDDNQLSMNKTESAASASISISTPTTTSMTVEIEPGQSLADVKEQEQEVKDQIPTTELKNDSSPDAVDVLSRIGIKVDPKESVRDLLRSQLQNIGSIEEIVAKRAMSNSLKTPADFSLHMRVSNGLPVPVPQLNNGGSVDNSSSTGIKMEVKPEVSDEDLASANISLQIENDVADSAVINECGVCGPTRVMKSDVVDSLSPHGKSVKGLFPSSADTFWIACDICTKWFHGRCVGVEEYEDGLIEKFHCAICSKDHGPTIMRPCVAPHRLQFDDISQVNLPVEIGTKVWVETFVQTEAEIPAPSSDDYIWCENGSEFMEKFDRSSEWEKIFLIGKPDGLGLSMPGPDFFIDELIECFGADHVVDTIDVWRQVTHSMSLGAFRRKLRDVPRQRLFNFLSLEFSNNEKMRELVAPPLLVPEISLVHRLWPDAHDPINWDSDMDYLPSAANAARALEVSEEHKKSKPDVALFCLCGMANSYTDFHIDFGGSSVWYHIFKGEKVFYVVAPTPSNLAAFEEHQKLPNRSEVFFGDMIPKAELKRVVIREKQTMMIPSGWIHAVLTPKDSMVFGGNFLHHLNVPMQLRVYDIEQNVRRAVGTDEKFLFPQFELVHWYTARSFMIDSLRDASEEGNKAEKWLFDAAQALIPRLEAWLERDRELANRSIMYASSLDVLRKLKKRFEEQKKYQSPAPSPSKGNGKKKKAKKRRSGVDSDDDDVYEPRPLKFRINKRAGTCSSTVSTSFDATKMEDPVSPKTRSSRPSSRDSAEQQQSVDCMASAATVMEPSSPTEGTVMRLIKKGQRYSSEVIEKPSAMIDDVNMAHMFAPRSSTGRVPKPSNWLAAAAGVEIDKEARKLEEAGTMPVAREPLLDGDELDAIAAAEERELERGQTGRQKKKTGTKPKTGAIDAVAKQPRKPSNTTVRQRLAAKLRLGK